MVFAYALLGVSDHREEAADVLAKTEEILVPDSIWPELLNVAWKWVKVTALPASTARAALRDAQALATESVPVTGLWDLAFELALDRDHPPYDTLLVALAMQRSTRVVTYDGRLLKAFPEHTVKPGDFLGTGATASA
jgi:predicted nucleic acid-binding protein